MEKVFLTSAWLYRCDTISWWNDGTERKPSKKYFDTLQWTEIKNKNMKWLSIFNLELTVPIEYEFNFFRLGYSSPHDGVVLEPNEYYYVEKELSRTSKNKTLLLTLDIWCTYIIGQTNGDPNNNNIRDMNVQTNRYLIDNPNSAKLSPLKKIYSYGYPINTTPSQEFMSWADNKTVDYKNMFMINCYLSFRPTNILGYDSSKTISISNFYKYYVFLTADPTENINFFYDDNPNGFRVKGHLEFRKSFSKYVLIIPVMFQWCGEFVSSKWGSPPINEKKQFQNGGKSVSTLLLGGSWNLSPTVNEINRPIHVEYYLFNDEDNLVRLAERINEHKNWSGISKFLGVFYGEHFLKLANTKIYNGKDYIFIPDNRNFEHSVFVSTQNKGSKLRFTNFHPINGLVHYDSTTNENNNIELHGFACAYIPYTGLDINDMGSDYGNYVVKTKEKNLNILGLDDYDFIFGRNKIYFTDRFVLSNGYNKLELDSEVPLILDDYYNVLQATKPQRDAALRTAAGNLATSAVRDWLPPAIHGNGVFAEKTAWGGYWDTQANYLNVKSATGFMSQLHPEDWVVSPKGSVLKPWANKNALLEAQKSRLVGADLKKIGSADKLMGKISGGLGIASSAANVIGSSIQFANTLYGLKKQQEQIRLQTSSNLTSTSASFLDKKYFFDSNPVFYVWDNNLTDRENTNILCSKSFGDVFYGYRYFDMYNLSSYYGQEMFYEELSITIKDLEDGWIVMSDGEMLFRRLYNIYRYKLRNETIQAIVQMLTQGVRVKSQP